MRSFIIFILCLFLTACMVGPNFHTPTPPKISRYTRLPLPSKTAGNPKAKNASKAQFFADGYDVPGEWWRLFHSKELNLLIQTGLENSPNLQAAQASLRQAEENWRGEIGNLLLPSFNGQAGWSRQHGFNQLPGSATPNATFDLYNLAGNFNYVFDFWGASRRQLEGLKAQVDYQKFELEAAYLTLTSNIATTYITIASLEAQIKALKELVREQETTLTIVEKQFKLGSASGADVLSAETQLAQTRAQLPPLVQSLAQAYDALSALVGKFPSEMSMPKIQLSLLNLPQSIPVSLPSAIVQQRPDIRAQEALVHQASAQIGVATANLLPQFTLAGYGGQNSDRLENLFKEINNYWNIGFSLTQPIFHGGYLIHARRAAIAGYDQAFDTYKQTVLNAVQNVSDSFEALKNDAFAFQAEKEAEISAQKTLSLTTKQYRLGAVNYLQLLTAQNQYQQAKINRIKAQTQRFSDTVALFQALGGGWWNRNLKIPPPQNTEIHS